MFATRSEHSIERMDFYLHFSFFLGGERGGPVLKFRGECAVVIVILPLLLSACCIAFPSSAFVHPLYHLSRTCEWLAAAGLQTTDALKPQCVQEQDQNLLGGFFGGVTDGLGALGSTVMGSPPPMAASSQDSAAKAPAAP